jgi:hypothetical protein
MPTHAYLQHVPIVERMISKIYILNYDRLNLCLSIIMHILKITKNHTLYKFTIERKI